MSSYESIKSCLRLLLTSAPDGLTLDQLNTDYQHYNQSKQIPYANFGYTTLFGFVRDMPDVARFDVNSFPPIVYGVKKTISSKLKRKVQLSMLNSKTTNTRSLKSVKRLVLNTLPINHRQFNHCPTEHIIDQFTNLTMDRMDSMKNISENDSSQQILTISINSMEECRIVRCSNGKFYISCFELSRLLKMSENDIDKETMFSRLRIYQSNDLYPILKQLNHSCQHAKHSHRPYVFLFLIASIVPVLKMTNHLNQHDDVVRAFERFLSM